MRSFFFTHCLTCLVSLSPALLGLTACFSAFAQEPAAVQEPYPIKGQIVMDPELMQIDLPQGRIRLSGDVDRLVTHDQDNHRVVARIHTLVGDNFIVLLPDGQLVGRTRAEVEATQKEFVPATHQEIADAIIEAHGLSGFQVETTDHFVMIYNTSPEFAKMTSRMMESMLEGVLKNTRAQGLDTHPPEIPLPIVAFHRMEQFQQYQPMPPDIAAYYEIQSNRVVLKEESVLDALGRDDLAAKDRISTIAHEGCHQLLHNIGVQQRLSRWPMWLGEGLAEFMAPTELGKKFAWKGTGRINDMRMYELEIFLQKQFVKGFNGETLDQTIRAGVLDSTGYSAAWALTHFLAKEHEKKFNSYMRYLSRMAPLHGMLPAGVDMKAIKSADDVLVEENMTHFKAFFGEDLAKLENDLIEFMRVDSKRSYMSPVANYPHWVGLCTAPHLQDGKDDEKRFSCFFIHQADVVEWLDELKTSLNSYENEHAEVFVRQFPNRGTANKDITLFMKGRLDPRKPGRRR